MASHWLEQLVVLVSLHPHTETCLHEEHATQRLTVTRLSHVAQAWLCSLPFFWGSAALWFQWHRRGAVRGCELGHSHQLTMVGCLWGDGAWGRKVAAARGPERSSSSFLGLLGAGKARAGGCPGINVTQDRSQYVSLTSNLTPAKAEHCVTAERHLAPGKCLCAEAVTNAINAAAPERPSNYKLLTESSTGLLY